MRIVLISDTHGLHRKVKIPEGDVIVHAGDCSSIGRIDEVADFLMWYGKLDFTRKILISGNHDFLFQTQLGIAQQMCYENDVTYLHDTEIIHDGVKFYGSAFTPEFGNWAFNLPRGEELANVWAKIPVDVDVLITHEPPYGVLDCVEHVRHANEDPHVGCADLAERLCQIAPKVHVFGHIHCAYGERKLGPTHYLNVAICDEKYNPTNSPKIVTI